MGLEKVVSSYVLRGRGGDEAAAARGQEHVHLAGLDVELVAEAAQENVESEAEKNDGGGGHEEYVEMDEEEEVGHQSVHHSGQDEEDESEPLDDAPAGSSPHVSHDGLRPGLGGVPGEVGHPELGQVPHQDGNTGVEIETRDHRNLNYVSEKILDFFSLH